MLTELAETSEKCFSKMLPNCEIEGATIIFTIDINIELANTNKKCIEIKVARPEN